MDRLVGWLIDWLAHSPEVSDYDHVTQGLWMVSIMLGHAVEQSSPPHDKQKPENQDTSWKVTPAVSYSSSWDLPIAHLT